MSNALRIRESLWFRIFALDARSGNLWWRNFLGTGGSAELRAHLPSQCFASATLSRTPLDLGQNRTQRRQRGEILGSVRRFLRPDHVFERGDRGREPGRQGRDRVELERKLPE